MINTSKPTTSLTNGTRVAVGLTWANILTTWASETDTWLAVSQLLANSTKVSSSVTNIAKP